MAKAEVLFKQPVVAPPVDKIVLELTPDEAQALYFVLQHVGGSPDHSPRGHIQNIEQCLGSVGCSCDFTDPDDIVEPPHSIMFRDRSKLQPFKPRFVK
jgi:hypothetical protein